MRSLILSEYIQEEKEELIASIFNISIELATECLNNTEGDLDAIREYISNKGNNKVMTVRCKYCGRRLTDPESVKRGYGEDCYRKIKTEIYEDIFKER